MKFFFLKFEIFLMKIIPHTITINFARGNKSIMANKLLLTNLERFIIRIKSPLTRY